MEEVKTLRTIKEFIAWYEGASYQFILSPRDAESLRKFYEKFKYLLEEENKANEAIRKFLG